MKKKGFTLIELLAVIIILAVVALIATPVVLNVIEEAKLKADRDSVYGLIDSAKLYYVESMLDTDKKTSINGTTDILNELSISGKKPESGKMFINSRGETALAVVYGKVCFLKNFIDNDITESNDIENCNITNIETPDVPTEPIEPEVSYKCKKAEVLHEEICQNESDYGCGASNYSKGDKIYYGSLGEKGVLKSGDAFDCDVNGDKKFDSVTERFYYVSDLYDASINDYNSDYAVLIYYNNTTTGTPDNTSTGLVPYNINNVNNKGPISAITNLPTTTQWSNVTLYNANRKIINEKGGLSLASYSYEGYAARPLSYKELIKACVGTDKSPSTDGYLDSCPFLLENTKYSDSTLGTFGYILETPYSSGTVKVWRTYGNIKVINYHDAKANTTHGVRPVIEVLKTDIEI